MKLAYINEIPEYDQWNEFIRTYTEECIMNGCGHPVDWNQLQAGHVISVYDENKLVGIGCLAGEPSIHVRPAYEHREIEPMVTKLLKAESKFGSLHG
ncbi:hypothetical protein ACFPES_04690 [Paenibacillus sp. GCM10023248]|uniref:hypothetical protein n=1 Tax=Bacillales TaxID=1385 RepID=UPI0023784B17|nr:MULTISPECIES: hypothetical protein [Bacillales]MDD9266324.1 hypothetical protein [Paenibacillus sp. MAHUQ-63]MDR6878447.1 hypothetical protein [Bacillus sp. 3255]